MKINWLPIFLFLALSFSANLKAQDSEITEPTAAMVNQFKDSYLARPCTKEEVSATIKIVSQPSYLNQSFLETLKEYIIISFFPTHYENSLKDCFDCQRILAGTVEMHNQEHSLKLRRINNKMLCLPLTPLIPEYLKLPFPMPREECNFQSIGDATKDSLFIYCTFHGSPQTIDKLQQEITDP